MIYPSRKPLLFAVAAAVAAAIGCNDTTPSRATAPMSGAGQVVAQVRAAQAVATPLIDDASGRISAAMQDAATRDRVRALLDRLTNALERDDGPRARTQIAQIRRLIASRSHSADAADLAALGLALDQLEARLADTTTTH